MRMGMPVAHQEGVVHSQTGGGEEEQLGQRRRDAVREQGVEPGQRPRHPMQGQVRGRHRVVAGSGPAAVSTGNPILLWDGDGMGWDRRGAHPSPERARASASPMSCEHCDSDTTSRDDRNTFPGSKVRVANGPPSLAVALQEVEMDG